VAMFSHPRGRALDIGCAVGRSAFELARQCDAVIGIDFSRRFIEAADELKTNGFIRFDRVEEGARVTSAVAEVPADIPRERVIFQTGDAMNLPHDLGVFDLVLAANLICRLREPGRFLQRLAALVKPGGELVITTPCTWLEEYTPREHWLATGNQSTLEGLQRYLEPDFELISRSDLPFVIREHARKFQWIHAEATLWKRRSAPYGS
jgi:putative 4-mercaptohistidine N1-methyltranferase